MVKSKFLFSILHFNHLTGLRIFFLSQTMIALLFLFAGCESDKIKTNEQQPIDSTAIKDSLLKLEQEKLKITYHYFPDSGRVNYTGLKKQFEPEEIEIILSLNRLDAKNFSRRDSVVVPDSFHSDFLRYSPFPVRLAAADSVRKILLFSHRIQAFAAYENGKLVRWGPTSLGKKSTPTPNGLYHTNWKAKRTVSTVNEEWILPWAFNLDNFAGISLHEFDLPGYPASHACARLTADDAKWIYYWAEQWILSPGEKYIIAYGTPVIIYDEYNFGGKPPWHFLPQNPDTTKEKTTKLDSLVHANLKLILNRQNQRDSVITAREKP